jgi:putative flippase GtrA
MNPKLKRILFSKPVKFLKGGVLLKCFSFLLNYILVDLLNFPVNTTYIFVLVSDFFVGFLINRYFVFNDTKKKDSSHVFMKFLIAGIGFRALNWLLYVAIIDKTGMYILYSQFIATVLVLVLKFSVYKKIFK